MSQKIKETRKMKEKEDRKVKLEHRNSKAVTKNDKSNLIILCDQNRQGNN